MRVTGGVVLAALCGLLALAGCGREPRPLTPEQRRQELLDSGQENFEQRMREDALPEPSP
jgi:hypothetical protein